MQNDQQTLEKEDGPLHCLEWILTEFAAHANELKAAYKLTPFWPTAQETPLLLHRKNG